jgi:hypothetical protein
VLLVIADAATESQVRGLQRAAGGTPVLVTSRRPPARLDGVQRIAVDRLPAADACRLLAALVPAEGTTARDLARLAELCDHVPLALRIAGNRVASRPGWTAAGLVDRLAVRGCRLDTLTAADLRLRTAISTSVDRLPTSTRRLSRLSGTTFGAASVAAVAGSRAGARSCCSTTSSTAGSCSRPQVTGTGCPGWWASTRRPTRRPPSRPGRTRTGC